MLQVAKESKGSDTRCNFVTRDKFACNFKWMGMMGPCNYRDTQPCHTVLEATLSRRNKKVASFIMVLKKGVCVCVCVCGVGEGATLLVAREATK